MCLNGYHSADGYFIFVCGSCYMSTLYASEEQHLVQGHYVVWAKKWLALTGSVYVYSLSYVVKYTDN